MGTPGNAHLEVLTKSVFFFFFPCISVAVLLLLSHLWPGFLKGNYNVSSINFTLLRFSSLSFSVIGWIPQN